MKTPTINSEPRLVKGSKPTVIPKGSTLEEQWAKKPWLVEYFYNGKRYRQTDNLNRIKDAKEKEKRAKLLLKAIKQELEQGYNPENPQAYLDKIKASHISLKDAVEEYLEEKGRYLRGKSVGSYESKLRYLVQAFPNLPVKNITAKQIENYIYDKIHKGEQAVMNMDGKVYITNKITRWTPATVQAARNYFRGFFNWCAAKEQGYITESPIADLNERKIRSEAVAEDRHIPFTPEDYQTILNYLEKNDRYTYLFCRMIYYTCLRPSEIVSLRIADVNLKDRTIEVPLSGMKNTKKTEADILTIDAKFIPQLQTLNLHAFPSDYYLFSNDYESVTGEQTAGHNRPYKRFVKALERLNLTGKGYTLYSFKHTSNINRWKGGWKIDQIMKANRHTSIQMTERYLKHLNRQTDISELSVPEF